MKQAAEANGRETTASRLRDRLHLFVLLTIAGLPALLFDGLSIGDTPSHAYNAWLAARISAGGLTDLYTVNVWTNSLCDHALVALMRLTSPLCGAIIAKSLLSVIFAGSAYAFVKSIGGRVWLGNVALLAMLTHGWVMHAGFSNFVLSSSLVLGALSLGARGQWSTLMVVSVSCLALLAVAAHPLPPLWCGACGIYLGMRRLRPTPEYAALAFTGAAVVFAGVMLALRYDTIWSPLQVRNVLGVDQLYVFDRKYAVLAGIAACIVGAKALCDWRDGWWPMRPALSIALLASIMTVSLPGAINLPGGPQLGAIASRLSLITGVAWCAVLAIRPWPRRLTGAMIALACVFFSMLFADWSALNRIQRDLTDSVRLLERDARVVAPILLEAPDAQPSRASLLMAHAVDQACLGHCLSYGNFEPSSRQFGVRCNPDSMTVLCDSRRVAELERGRFVVTDADSSLYVAEACYATERIHFRVRRARVGATIPAIRVWPFLFGGAQSASQNAECTGP